MKINISDDELNDILSKSVLTEDKLLYPVFDIRFGNRYVEIKAKGIKKVLLYEQKIRQRKQKLQKIMK